MFLTSIKFSALAVLAIFLAACGPRPPTDSFSANLDANCNPQDPVDKLRATVTAKKFWLEQEYDFKSFLKSGKVNLKNSQDFLAEADANREGYRAKVLERARELKLSAAKAGRMVVENMEIYDRQVQNFKDNIVRQEAELDWSNRCMDRINVELASLGISNIDLAPSQSSIAIPSPAEKMDTGQ